MGKLPPPAWKLVACPKCGALSGEKCIYPMRFRGVELDGRGDPHAARIEAARKARADKENSRG